MKSITEIITYLKSEINRTQCLLDLQRETYKNNSMPIERTKARLAE